MRTRNRLMALAAAVICSAGLGGCEHIDRHIHGGPIAAPALEQPQPAVRRAKRPRSVVKRVVRPGMVPAGARIRSFCGQRHVRFQSGALRENASEKARNDVLCSQTR